MPFTRRNQREVRNPSETSFVICSEIVMWLSMRTGSKEQKHYQGRSIKNLLIFWDHSSPSTLRDDRTVQQEISISLCEVIGNCCRAALTCNRDQRSRNLIGVTTAVMEVRDQMRKVSMSAIS